MRVTFSMIGFFMTAVLNVALAADSPQFRGPDRNGIYTESGLLQNWPSDGPPLLWNAGGLGQGFASVSVVDGMVFTTGMKDMQGHVAAVHLGGKPAWIYEYGEEHHGSGFPGTRSTPTFNDGRVYVITGRGKAICLDATNGEKIWDLDLLARFGGSATPDSLIPRWSVVESPLILGDRLITTPGTPDVTMAALDKNTGEVIWTTKGGGEKSGYCSPRLYEGGGTRQIITMTANAIIGVNPDDGTLLWRKKYDGKYEIHANSPVFMDDLMYVSDGYGQGGAAFRIKPGGKGITKVWSEKELDIHHGGIVLHDGKIYGAASNGDWMVLDAATGKVLAETEAVGKGSVIYADGRLIVYGEKGRLGIMTTDPADFRLLNAFKIERGTGQHWAHPVVSNGVLYIRHGDALMAFDIGDS